MEYPIWVDLSFGLTYLLNGFELVWFEISEYYPIVDRECHFKSWIIHEIILAVHSSLKTMKKYLLQLQGASKFMSFTQISFQHTDL